MLTSFTLWFSLSPSSTSSVIEFLNASTASFEMRIVLLLETIIASVALLLRTSLACDVCLRCLVNSSSALSVEKEVEELKDTVMRSSLEKIERDG